MAATAFDGDDLPSISGSGSNCWIRIDFTQGMVGALDELRFFMDYFGTATNYNGNLIF